MDRKEYKSKPQHLVTDARNGEIVRIVHPSNTDIGSSQIPADLKVYGFGFIPDLRSPTTIAIFGHRLSLTSGEALPTADVAAGSVLYLTPHTSNCVSLYDPDSSTWQVKQSNSVTYTLTGLTSGNNYDVYIFWDTSSTTLKLELVAWTSDTVRATALVRQDGVYVKTGDLTRRYAGTIRTTSATTTADTVTKRFVWNHYNQVQRHMTVTDTSVSWTYAVGATWRQARATSANRVECVVGIPTHVEAIVNQMVANSAASHTRVGVGIDSTTTNSAQISLGYLTGAGPIVLANASYRGTISAGYHAINWIEWTEGGTATFYGQSSVRDPGLLAAVWA